LNIKLDENFGRRGAELLRSHGHDVATVFDQRLQGATDASLAIVCRSEQRCLVTLDRDFSNPLTFNPETFSGIAVLRLPDPIRMHEIELGLRTLISGLEEDDIRGQLWTVELNRIRKYQPDN
jgi:predicted nuclease of predicted toxin-antitoxin system